MSVIGRGTVQTAAMTANRTDSATIAAHNIGENNNENSTLTLFACWDSRYGADRMITIPLSPLKYGYSALIDDADAEQILPHRWRLKITTKGTCTMRYAFRCIGKARKDLTMHTQLLGRKPGFEIDHKDGNGLNNCRDNIRHATKSENQGNSRKRKDNSSGFKGVSFDAHVKSGTKKWRASVQCNNKRTHLGRYNTAMEAAQAYDAEAKKLFGEFAKLNFPKVQE